MDEMGQFLKQHASNLQGPKPLQESTSDENNSQNGTTQQRKHLLNCCCAVHVPTVLAWGSLGAEYPWGHSIVAFVFMV